MKQSALFSLLSLAIPWVGLATVEPALSTPGSPSQPSGFSLLTAAADAISRYDLAEAERLAQEAVTQTTAENGGENHPAVATALVALGRTLFRQERHDEAAAHLVRAQSLFDQTVGTGGLAAPALAEMIMECWHRAGRPVETLASADALDLRLANQPAPDEMRQLAATRCRGEALLDLGRVEEAEVALRRAQELARRLLSDVHPKFARLQMRLEEIRRRRGESVPPLFVGSLGSPRRLEFEGNASFTADDLRRALFKHPPTFGASHPSAKLSEFREHIQFAMVEGYRHVGFRDAVVEVEPGPEVIRVRITEGPSFRQGGVTLDGLRDIDATAFLKSLTDPPDPKAVRDRLVVIEEAEKLQSIEPAPASSSSSGTGSPPASPATPPDAGRPAPAAPVPTATTPSEVTVPPGAPGLLMPFSGTAEAVWVNGRPASFSTNSLERLKERIQYQFWNQGRPRARFEITTKIEKDTDAVALGIRVLEEGPVCIVGQTIVIGAAKNSPEAIIDFLGLQPGTPLRPQTLSDAKLALWDCGRFRWSSIVAKPRGQDLAEIDLTIEVKELGTAPPIGERLAPELEALRRCAGFLSTPEEWPGDLAIEMRGVAKELGAWMPGPIGSMGVNFAFSAAGGVTARTSMGKRGGQDLGFHLADRHLELFSLDRKNPMAWRTLLPQNGSASVGIGVMADRDLDGAGQFTFGMTASTLRTGPALQTSLLVAPAFLLGKGLASPLKVTRRRGELLLRNEEIGSLRLDAESGRLLEWVSHSTETTRAVWRFQKGLVRRLAGEADQVWKRTPEARRLETGIEGSLILGTWMLAKIAAAPDADVDAVSPLPLDESRPNSSSSASDSGKATAVGFRVIRSLDSVLRRLGSMLYPTTETATESDVPFAVPIDPALVARGNALVGMLGPGIFSLVDAHLPADSWLWKFTREVAYLASGHAQSADQVFADLLVDPTLGPVGCLVAAKLLQSLNHPAGKEFLRRATSLTRKEDFQRDWRLFTDLDWFGRDALLAVVDEVGRLTPDEIKALATFIPKDMADWLAGTVSSFKEKRGQPLAEVLGPGLDRWWDTALAGRVRQMALQTLSPPDPAVDAAVVAATVNGAPITRKEVAAVILFRELFADLAPLASAQAADGTSAAARATDALVLSRLATAFFEGNKGAIDKDQLEQLYQTVVHQAGKGNETAFLKQFEMNREELMSLLRLTAISGFVTKHLKSSVPVPSAAEVEAAAPAWLRRQAMVAQLYGVGFPASAPLSTRITWAEAIRELIVDGLPIEVIMHASAGPLAGNYLAGSYLGAAETKDLSGVWREAVMALNPGEVSFPQTMPSGMVVLFSMISKSDGPPLDPVPDRSVIAEALHEEKRLEVVRRFFAQARRAARIRLVDPPAGMPPLSPVTGTLEQLAERAPFNPGPQVALLFSHLREGNSALAAKAFSQIEFLDLNEEAWKQLSAALRTRQPAMAESAARAALRFDPESASGHRLLGQALVAQQKLPEAEAMMLKSISIRPESETYYSLGVMLEAAGRLDEAVASWQKAADLSPQSSEPWTALARGLTALGRAPEADQAARTASTLLQSRPPTADPASRIREELPAAHALPKLSSLLNLESLQDDLRPVSASWLQSNPVGNTPEKPSPQRQK